VQERIRRIDPLSPGQSARKPSGTQVENTTAKLDRVLDVLRSGKALLDRVDEYHQAPATNPFQESWNRFRLAIIAAEALPAIEFQASRMPVPYFEMVDELFLQSIVIRLASVLDEKLAEVVDERALPLQRRSPKLADRINAVRDAGLITNADDLHSVRELRNEIGHEANPKVLGWTDISFVADCVEQALVELGVATESPSFKVEEISLTEIVPTERPYELGRRDVVLAISADGSPFCSFTWPYVYFLDPAWKP
jgi:hypothetical protein